MSLCNPYSFIPHTLHSSFCCLALSVRVGKSGLTRLRKTLSLSLSSRIDRRGRGRRGRGRGRTEAAAEEGDGVRPQRSSGRTERGKVEGGGGGNNDSLLPWGLSSSFLLFFMEQESGLCMRRRRFRAARSSFYCGQRNTKERGDEETGRKVKRNGKRKKMSFEFYNGEIYNPQTNSTWFTLRETCGLLRLYCTVYISHSQFLFSFGRSYLCRIGRLSLQNEKGGL